MADPGEANLRGLTNEEWLASHERLRESGAIPEHELAHVWDPDLDAQTLVGPDEVEEAPRG